MSKEELVNNLNAAVTQAKEAKEEVKQEAKEANDTPQEDPQDPKEKSGSKYVKTDDPEVKARLSFLSKQIHASDERNQQLNVLVSELDKKLQTYETKQGNAETQGAIEIVEEQIAEAYKNGDFAKIPKLNRALAELTYEAKFKESPVKTEQTQPQSPFTQAEFEYVQELTNERPYLKSGHKDYEKAAKMAAAIAGDYDKRGVNIDIPTLLDKVHERMTPNKAAEPEVLPSNLTQGGSGGKLRLSEEQIRISQRLGLTEERIKNSSKYVGKNTVSIKDYGKTT